MARKHNKETRMAYSSLGNLCTMSLTVKRSSKKKGKMEGKLSSTKADMHKLVTKQLISITINNNR